MATLEKSIEKEILIYLYNKGIFCWKQNTIGVYDSKKGVYRRPRNKFIISGVSDILAIYKGRFIAIEVKTPSRKNLLSEDQKQFIKNVIESGGLAFVATSALDVEKFFNEQVY